MQLGVHDVARILNVSEKSIYRWIQKGQLPAYKVNDQYRFNRVELLEWANAQKINASEEIFQKIDTSVELMPSVAEAIEAGGIFYRLAGDDKPSVLRSVVEVMKLPPDMDRRFLLQVLLAREAMASTGVGDGVAIPHVRSPIVLSVNHPAICLCFPEKPVAFDAIDNQLVHTLFTLVAPSVRVHLFLLSRLASALRDPGFKDALKRQLPQNEIIAIVRALTKESKG